MKLLTKELEAALPPLYSTEKEPDPTVHLKLFSPSSAWTWYATEYDPANRLFFGLVIGHEAEMGYFSLKELEAIRLPFGLKIERDLHFTPAPLSAVRETQRA